MTSVVVKRNPSASYAVLAVFLVLHFVFSYPSATCRGYPPTNPYVEYLAPFAAFVGVVFFPFFDDDKKTRRRIRYIFAGVSAYILGAVLGNHLSAVPRTGHLLRPLGIFVTGGPILFGPLIFVVVLVYTYCVERIFVDFWKRVRTFAS